MRRAGPRREPVVACSSLDESPARAFPLRRPSPVPPVVASLSRLVAPCYAGGGRARRPLSERRSTAARVRCQGRFQSASLTSDMTCSGQQVGTRSMTQTQRATGRLCLLMAVLASTLLLAACTIDDNPEPRATATPTAVTFGPDDV